ncbi:hypothetical protein ABKN59_011648 [Abortiporus biennis]
MSMARRNETKSGLLESVVVMREQLWKERETNARSAKSRWPSISDLEYARKHLRTMGYISSTRLEIIRRSIDWSSTNRSIVQGPTNIGLCVTTLRHGFFKRHRTAKASSSTSQLDHKQIGNAREILQCTESQSRPSCSMFSSA